MVEFFVVSNVVLLLQENVFFVVNFIKTFFVVFVEERKYQILSYVFPKATMSLF